MADPSHLHRTLCCGATCGRGTPEAGPCVAATYGAAIDRRLAAAGYVVATAHGIIETSKAAWADWLEGHAAATRGLPRLIIQRLAQAARTADVGFKN